MKGKVHARAKILSIRYKLERVFRCVFIVGSEMSDFICFFLWDRCGCNKHYFYFRLIVFIKAPSQTQRRSNRPRIVQEPTKNRRLDFSVGPTLYLRSDRPMENRATENRRRAGFAKVDGVLLPVNSISFSSVRPKMVGGYDGIIRPPVFGPYKGC